MKNHAPRLIALFVSLLLSTSLADAGGKPRPGRGAAKTKPAAKVVTAARPAPVPFPAVVRRPPGQSHPLAASAATQQLAEDPALEAALRRYHAAILARDVAALRNRVLPAFERVAASRSVHAPLAADYATRRLPRMTRQLYPCPEVTSPTLPAGLLDQRYRSGELVSPTLLDARAKWLRCSEPEATPAAERAVSPRVIAQLQVFINERGTVTGARPRDGRPPDPLTRAASAEVLKWRATPPTWRGKPVKTALSVDIALP